MRLVIGILFVCFLGFNGNAQIQPQTLGIRVGNPLGLTYKKYFPQDRAIELIVGSVPRSWHYQYYQKSFDNFDQFESEIYVSHAVQGTLYLQSRYLQSYQGYVEGIDGKVFWYWGLGGVLKLAHVRYQFRDFQGGPIEESNKADFDLGPEIIIGTEYDFYGAPFTAFGEVSLAAEIMNRPLSLRPLGAVGIRVKL